MFTFLLVVQAVIGTALVAVILMQRSEGGALGVGGSPAGLMSARGAANFLTHMTTILAIIFVVLSITMAVLAAVKHAPSQIDTSLVKAASSPAGAPATQPAPPGNDALAGAAQSVGNQSGGATGVPLAR